MSGAYISLVLNCLSTSGCILAALRLWYTGLYRRYRALLWFLLCVAVADILLLALRNSAPRTRTIVWEIFQPLTWFFSVWVVLELYSLILERHQGLSTFGRWIQYVGFSISTIVSLLAMVPKLRSEGVPFLSLLSYYYPIERGIDCGMLVFLTVILVWLTRYPLPLSRNVVIHAVVYSLLFFSNSIGTLSLVFFGYQITARLSTVLTGIFALCVFSWAALLTEKGEEVSVVVPKFDAQQEARLLHQLDALNNVLLKVSKN